MVCIGGLGMLVASDHLTSKDWPAASLVKGDLFMILGASFYGFSELFSICDFVRAIHHTSRIG
jgi:hypothetical protein